MHKQTSSSTQPNKVQKFNNSHHKTSISKCWAMTRYQPHTVHNDQHFVLESLSADDMNITELNNKWYMSAWTKSLNLAQISLYPRTTFIMLPTINWSVISFSHQPSLGMKRLLSHTVICNCRTCKSFMYQIITGWFWLMMFSNL